MAPPNIKVMNSPPTSMKFFTASPDLGAIEHYLVNIIYKINRINKTVKMNTLFIY